jgi:hypothetical protein
MMQSLTIRLPNPRFLGRFRLKPKPVLNRTIVIPICKPGTRKPIKVRHGGDTIEREAPSQTDSAGVVASTTNDAE